MYRKYNPNPTAARVGDCTVRAICGVTDREWIDVYLSLAAEGLIMGDMPNANSVWGSYLRSLGFKRHVIPDTCPNCYTVEDFCADHPEGRYVLALNGHVVCAKGGDWFDSWDSGGERPVYYWEKEGD